MKRYRVVQTILLTFLTAQDKFDCLVKPDEGVVLEANEDTIWAHKDGQKQETITAGHMIDLWVKDSKIEEVTEAEASAAPEPKKYSFCESVHATATSKWHIRELTAIGQKFGGGADTLALCGRDVAWDLNVERTDLHLLTNTCPRCFEFYRKARLKGGLWCPNPRANPNAQ